ncbi:hypothetical protein HAZT_HAZT006076 [Hyalella azteca]|uniref:Peptidase aspartic putative domain-containing protein n=1 Tax=Hyalella azteca TaxID=294128 RepID=A0A6A0GW60_HYAAZ|nr:hypothetical protein HAZT_HAZT006076 [Hyalella azteca]
MALHQKDVLTEQDVEELTHLNVAPFKFMDSDILLLLGMNAPELIKPRDVIGGEDNLPFATRHALGWAMNGPVDKCAGLPSEKLSRVTNPNLIPCSVDVDKALGVIWLTGRQA